MWPNMYKKKPPRASSGPDDGLLEPDFAPHWKAWKAAPGPQTADALLQAVRPVLTEAARTYAGASAGSPTLMGAAKTMALDAMAGYDPSRAKLRTHLLSRLQGLRRVGARQAQLVRVPEGAAIDLSRLRDAQTLLSDELGREPSDAELADHTGLSLLRLGRLRAASGPAVASGTISRSDTTGSGWSPPIQSGPVDKKLVSTWLRVVHADADPIDQVILERTFGLHGHARASNQEIARMVRLSPGAVSQRRLRLQKKIDLAEGLGLF